VRHALVLATHSTARYKRGMTDASESMAPVDGWSVWRVDDGGENFWVAVHANETALAVWRGQCQVNESGDESAVMRPATTREVDRPFKSEEGTLLTVLTDFVASNRQDDRCLAATVY
jgi:hypothetical protein